MTNWSLMAGSKNTATINLGIRPVFFNVCFSVFCGLVHWLLFGLVVFWGFFFGKKKYSQLWNNLANEVAFISSLNIFHILTPTELIVLDPEVTGQAFYDKWHTKGLSENLMVLSSSKKFSSFFSCWNLWAHTGQALVWYPYTHKQMLCSSLVWDPNISFTSTHRGHSAWTQHWHFTTSTLLKHKYRKQQNSLVLVQK